MKTIFIVGAGAIGKALAVILTRHQQSVVLLRGSVDNLAPYEETITLALPDEQVLQATVSASSIQQHAFLDGLIVLTNKSYGNERIAALLRDRTGHSPIVILQNGLRVEEAFASPAFPAVYRCVLFVTSQFAGEGAIRFRPVAACPIGPVKGSGDQLDRIVQQLDTPSFPFRAEPAIEPIIWKKAIANSVFNSICPLLETDNGIFHRDQRVLAIAKTVIAECLLVARTRGIVLSAEEVLESVLMISRLSDGQLISTLQDMRQQRPTEITTLNAAIAGFAGELGLESLVPATALLGQLTLLKSTLNR